MNGVYFIDLTIRIHFFLNILKCFGVAVLLEYRLAAISFCETVMNEWNDCVPLIVLVISYNLANYSAFTLYSSFATKQYAIFVMPSSLCLTVHSYNSMPQQQNLLRSNYGYQFATSFADTFCFVALFMGFSVFFCKTSSCHDALENTFSCVTRAFSMTRYKEMPFYIQIMILPKIQQTSKKFPILVMRGCSVRKKYNFIKFDQLTNKNNEVICEKLHSNCIMLGSICMYHIFWTNQLLLLQN